MLSLPEIVAPPTVLCSYCCDRSNRDQAKLGQQARPGQREPSRTRGPPRPGHAYPVAACAFPHLSSQRPRACEARAGPGRLSK